MDEEDELTRAEGELRMEEKAGGMRAGAMRSDSTQLRTTGCSLFTEHTHRRISYLFVVGGV